MLHQGYLWANFTLGCIGFICSSFVIFTYFAWKQGRKSPGDIILALAISSILFSTYWIVFPIYFLSTNLADSTEEPGPLCKTFGMMSALGLSGQFIYNFAYCLTLRQAITNVLKLNQKFKLITQSICFLLTIAIPSSLLINGQIGIDNMGVCAFRLNETSIFIEIVLQFIYIISALYTIWFFYQNIPNDESLKSNKQKLIVRYVIYIGSTVIMLMFMAISNIAEAIISKSEINSNDAETFSLIANIASTAGPMMLCFVRLKNSQIRQKLKRLLSSAFMLEDKMEIEIPQKDLSSSAADTQFSDLQKNIRIFQIKTILRGIIHYYKKQNEASQIRNLDLNIQSINNLSIDQPLIDKQLMYDSEEDYQISQTLKLFNLNNEELNNEYRIDFNTEERIANQNLSLYPEMVALSPLFFKILMQFDEIGIDASDSFCPVKNAKIIENMVGPDGGKSGEFFFFTYDNKWILKTVSLTELQAFRQIMPQYVHHMKQNKDSLINKIYGIFSIDMNQMQTSLSNDCSVYHMVLMKNLSQVPSRFVKRRFDLKGSEVAREVLKGGKSESVDLSKITLKDKDFFNTEQVVNIDAQSKQLIQEQLIRDAQFFEKAKLMDYSLLVMKVCWEEFLQENPGTYLADIKKNFNDLQFLLSKGDQKSTYYHIAIIDYLQEWNLKKQTEKAAKQVMALSPNLDTSAQSPDVYAKRFIQNVVNRIF